MNNRRSRNWIWGIIFILAAAVLVVKQLGYMEIMNGISLFQVIMAIILIPCLIGSIVKINFPGIFFSLAFLCIVFGQMLGITHLVPWTVLIVATLASIGFSLIFKRNRIIVKNGKNYANYEEIITEHDENSYQYSTSFSSSIQYVNSKSLRRVDISCSFGAMKVYFDNSKLDPDGATIKLETNFSGVELYIPRTWNVDEHIEVALGAVKAKNFNEGGDGPTLTLIGEVNIGGVEIIYV